MPSDAETLTPEDLADIAAFETLPLDAQLLFGIWFGAGRKDSFTLRHGLKEWKPTTRTQAALDVLLSAGFISVEQEPCGAKVYRMLKDAHAALLWAMAYIEANDAQRAAAKWRLMEPVA
ncbi:hypothetical protein KABACHOK_02940 [Brevundimonas phage vB_BpoS-Kabachok]|uniref:Uncharacterized protein n=2 Tax=Marchewkavirus TaxID=3425052 RepID=A0A9E7MPE8_9CAUD|nr:hypothetical protein KABACHOK_02940 [Brevundimonas phage vB_BpoS-Kabachok]